MLLLIQTFIKKSVRNSVNALKLKYKTQINLLFARVIENQ